MKRMNPSLFALLLSLFLVGCVETDREVIFPKSISLTGRNWQISGELGSVYGLYSMDNYLLIHNVLHGKELSIVAPNDRSRFFHFGYRGRGSGELFNSLPIYTLGDEVYVYVQNRRTVVNFKLDEQNLSTPYITEYPFDSLINTSLTSLCTLSDSSYLASGVFPNGKRFGLFDRDGHNPKFLMDYPEDPLIDESTPHYITGVRYISLLCQNRDGDRIASATMYGGLLQLFEYNAEGKALREIATHELSKSGFRITNYYGTPNFASNEDTRWGYLSLCADDRYVYALYSGRLQDKQGSSFLFGNTIHVFDWDGEPQCVITLDQDASSMTVHRRVIYTLVDNEQAGYDIAEYKVPL